ncbi:MAG TPA: signal peptidase II [Capillimicrobium sp.]|nr:signal peptidase II [Capillimicrobium sp.]
MSARRAWARVAAVGAAVLVADQVTKALVRADVQPGEHIELLPFLDLVHVRNDGIAFGALGGSGIVLALVIAAVVGIVAFFATHTDRRGAWLTTGLLLGGALGNVIDRIRIDAVTDFLKLPHWPAFNVADIAITVGVISLVFVLDDRPRR